MNQPLKSHQRFAPDFTLGGGVRLLTNLDGMIP